MDPAQLLREARRHAGYDQRRLAAASGLSLRTVVEVESGRRRVSAHALDALLAACGLDLGLFPRSDGDACEHLRHHLRLSTSARLHLSMGGDGVALATGSPLWLDLARLAEATEVLLDGPAAAGTWVPGLPVPTTVAVGVWATPRRSPLPRTPSVTVRELQRPRGRGPWDRAVRVATPRLGAVRVPPPAELLLDRRCDQVAPALRAAARCLHLHSGRDAGDRRAPPQCQPDEEGEAYHLGRSLTHVLLARPPSATDSRGWRTDSSVSLRQWLEEQGFPRRKGDSRGGRR